MVFPICFKSFPSCSDFVTLAVPLRAFLCLYHAFEDVVASCFACWVHVFSSCGCDVFRWVLPFSPVYLHFPMSCSLHSAVFSNSSWSFCLFVYSFPNCFLGNCVVVCADETVFPRFGNFIALIVSDVKTRPNCVPIVVKEAIHREADRMLSLRRSLTWIAYRILKASVWPCSPRFQ